MNTIAKYGALACVLALVGWIGFRYWDGNLAGIGGEYQQLLVGTDSVEIAPGRLGKMLLSEDGSTATEFVKAVDRSHYDVLLLAIEAKPAEAERVVDVLAERDADFSALIARMESGLLGRTECNQARIARDNACLGQLVDILGIDRARYFADALLYPANWLKTCHLASRLGLRGIRLSPQQLIDSTKAFYAESVPTPTAVSPKTANRYSEERSKADARAVKRIESLLGSAAAACAREVLAEELAMNRMRISIRMQGHKESKESDGTQAAGGA